MNIGIIADDLTSAADASLPFFNEGASCEVVRKYHNNKKADVLSIDSNSRNLTQADASEVVGKFSALLAHRDILLKTVDSTLRGHIKAEIKAAFLASNRAQIVIAPAFAAAGRTTINGYQYVDGMLVANSNYKNDPAHPCKHSRITDLIDSSLGEAVILPEDADAVTVERAMQAHQVIILDAQSQASLNRLVSYIANPNKVLWVGSVGLSYALAKGCQFATQRPPYLTECKKALVVIGSANDISREQKNALQHPAIMLDQKVDSLITFPDIAIISAPAQSVGSAKLLLQQLSLQAANVLKAGNYSALIATGGETTNAILEQLGVASFSIVDEFEPGFPVGIAADAGLPAPLMIGLKAGGFGTPTSLKNALDKLIKR